MKDLASFLQKFKALIRDSREEKQTLKDVLKQVVGTELDDQNISIKDNIATLSVSPTIRTEVYLKREEVFKKLEEFGSKIKEVR